MRIVVVGYGRAGKQNAIAIEQAHGASLHSVLEAADDVAVHPHSRATSWPDVLADSQVEGVALCLPPGPRAELAIAALQAGKKTLVEKPPAMSIAELDRLGDAGGQVAVMLQHRFRLPSTPFGGWGGDCAGSLLVSRPRSPSQHYTGWRGDAGQALGGITAHLGIHYLDLACQLLGEVDGVDIADYRECAPGIDVRTSGVVRFASGASLSFTVAADVRMRAEQLIIVGEDRRLEITDGAVTLQEGARVTRTDAAPTESMRALVYEEFVQKIDRCSLERARPVVTILDEVRKAGLR
jgi:predicted dehydrogenase